MTNPNLKCSIVKIWKFFLWEQEKDKDVHSHIHFNIVLDVLDRPTRQDKEKAFKSERKK